MNSGVRYGIALLIEALIFHWRVLFGRGFVFPWDFRTVHIPLAAFVADSLRRGDLPLWDPYTYCGYPIYANIQTALFYPPVLIATLLGAWLGDHALARILAISVVAQIIFAGICTYLLLRRLGARPAAAWVAGTMYELGCFFASQAEHMGAMQGACWLPLVWLCVLEVSLGARRGWLAALAAALAMTILAGLPQVALAAFVSGLALAVVLAAFRMGRWTAAAWIFLASLWAVLLAAIQFIPTYELVQNSVAKYRADWLKSGGGIHPGALVSLVIPNYWSVFDISKFHGPTDLTFLYLYSSILGLALAIAAAVWKPDLWGRVFAVLTLAAAITMLGDTTPVGRAVLAALPLSIRIGIHPEFFFCTFSLGLAVLAGLGVNRFARSTRLEIVAGVIIACDLLLVGSGRPMNFTSLRDEPGFTHDSADGNTEIVSQLRALANTAVPPWRFDTLPDMSFAWANNAPVLRIPTANGCDPLAPERIIQVRLSFSPGERWGTCFHVVNAASPVVSLINDRYLLSRAGGYRIEENKGALPRFFLVNNVKPASGLSDAAALLHSRNFRPAEFAIVEGGGDVQSKTGPAQVDVANYRPSEVTLRTHSEQATFLVATDAYYPGWEAAIDGNPSPIYPTDVAFRGIQVPAGDHTIVMRFVPRILYRSAIITGAAWIALFVFVGTQRQDR